MAINDGIRPTPVLRVDTRSDDRCLPNQVDP